VSALAAPYAAGPLATWLLESFFEIHARAERVTAAREHDDLRRRFEFVERLERLLQELRAERVFVLRSVQRHRRYVALLDMDGVELVHDCTGQRRVLSTGPRVPRARLRPGLFK